MENNYKPWPCCGKARSRFDPLIAAEEKKIRELDALLICIAVISAVALVLPSFLTENIPVPCPFDELKFEVNKP